MAQSSQSAPPLQNQRIIRDVTPAFTQPAVSDWVQWNAATFAVSISGTATSFTGQIIRSDFDPSTAAFSQAANTTPATSAATLTGAAGSVAPLIIYEPGMAWYAVNVTAISGGNVNVVMTGVSS